MVLCCKCNNPGAPEVHRVAFSLGRGTTLSSFLRTWGPNVASHTHDAGSRCLIRMAQDRSPDLDLMRERRRRKNEEAEIGGGGIRQEAGGHGSWRSQKVCP